MSTATAQRIAMRAIVINKNNEILVMREADKSYADGTNAGAWLVPGGRLEVGENWRDGLLREVCEEAGLNVQPVKPIALNEWQPVIKGATTQIVAVFFLCVAETTDVIVSEEHDEYKWISSSELSEMTLNKHEIEAVKEVFKIIEG